MVLNSGKTLTANRKYSLRIQEVSDCDWLHERQIIHKVGVGFGGWAWFLSFMADTVAGLFCFLSLIVSSIIQQWHLLGFFESCACLAVISSSIVPTGHAIPLSYWTLVTLISDKAQEWSPGTTFYGNFSRTNFQVWVCSCFKLTV
jgi:hypothetical protein